MSRVTGNQPEGTPTWVDLGIPDLDRARAFYGAVFGWEFQTGPAEVGRYTLCLLRGSRVAALNQNDDRPAQGYRWTMYFATSDCDRSAQRVVDAGGTIVVAPMDILDQGRVAVAIDAGGAQFGLWQGRGNTGAELVNEPGALVRNDLVTPDPETARRFYPAVFDFSLEANSDLPGVDFTFLHRPDGHEIGGIVGSPEAASAAWATMFEVADTDATVRAVTEAGGTAGPIEDTIYARISTVTDPFGTQFVVGARPST